jgi:hypothetical protein
MGVSGHRYNICIHIEICLHSITGGEHRYMQIDKNIFGEHYYCNKVKYLVVNNTYISECCVFSYKCKM